MNFADAILTLAERVNYQSEEERTAVLSSLRAELLAGHDQADEPTKAEG